MPGKGHLPDLTERIVRTLKANTTRTVGGLGSNASPGMTRDRVAASRRGSSSGIAPMARASKVDPFSITGTGTASFTLTYTPVFDSWNVMLNGARVHYDEFTISGRTLTITTPADLFKGAATQGSPWALEIQYDYLSGVPTAPLAELGVSSLKYRQAAKGDTTAFWSTSYDDSAWSSPATEDISFGTSGGGLFPIYPWNGTTYDLQVRALVASPDGAAITLTYSFDDGADVYWNGSFLFGIGATTGGTHVIPSSAVLATNTLAILGVNSIGTGCAVIVEVS